MSRTTSIAGVRPLGWLARVRAHRRCLAWACPVQLLGAAGLAPITALGMGSRDDHARQRLGQSQGWCRRKSEIARARSWRQAEESRARTSRLQAKMRGDTASKTSPIWQSDHLTFCLSDACNVNIMWQGFRGAKSTLARSRITGAAHMHRPQNFSKVHLASFGFTKTIPWHRILVNVTLETGRCK